MGYTWSKKELLEIKKSKPEDLCNVEEMLEIVNNEFDLSNSSIASENGKFDFDLAKDNYVYNLEKYPNELLDKLLYYFTIDKDLKYILQSIKLSKRIISDKDLIDLGLECISELNSKYLTNLYKELINKKNHQLHITCECDTDEELTSIYGITYYLKNKKTYIAIFKENSFVDFITLIHEVMHAYFYKILDTEDYSYLSEIEGRFGDYLATQFVKKIGFEKEALELEELSYNDILYKSYLLYMNDLMFGTEEKKKFNFEKAKELYESELKMPWTVTDTQVKKYCSIRGEDKADDIFGFLILTDLIGQGYNNKELFTKLKILKMNDNADLINHFKDLNITFPVDDYKYAKIRRDIIRGRH